MAYDPKIHHRRSIRLRGYNYTRPGWYFLTVSAHGKEHVFGEIDGWDMRLNDFGRIVTECWNELPQHYPHLRLHEFVVMPNHVHGIVELLEEVGTGPRPLPTKERKSHGLPEIVRAFKSFSARGINSVRRASGKPLWQRNYFERVIRDVKDLEMIRDYIRANPARWRTNPDDVMPCENPLTTRRGGS
jgi:REP-associated tyrosine transposase